MWSFCQIGANGCTNPVQGVAGIAAQARKQALSSDGVTRQKRKRFPLKPLVPRFEEIRARQDSNKKDGPNARISLRSAKKPAALQACTPPSVLLDASCGSASESPWAMLHPPPLPLGSLQNGYGGVELPYPPVAVFRP